MDLSLICMEELIDICHIVLMTDRTHLILS